jgi:type I site-specific restriction endonuclease
MAYTEAVGIDEFKVELKEQLKSELDSDVKTKLENYDFYQNKVSSLLEDNKELNKTIIQLEGTVQTLEKMCSDYSKNEQSLLEEIKEHENSNTEAVEKIGKIREILHDGYGMFDKSVKLDKIISVIAVK